MIKCIFCFLISVSAFTFAQDNSKSKYFVINDSYPIPIGNNFISNNDYKGKNALDIGYYYNLLHNIYVGLNCRFAFVHGEIFNTTIEISNPSLSLNYHYDIGQFRLIPQINIGYSKYQMFSEGDISTPSFYFENNAFTLTSQMKTSYSITEKLLLGAFIAYDYSWLDKPKYVEKYFSYNQRIQFIYPGISLEVKI